MRPTADGTEEDVTLDADQPVSDEKQASNREIGVLFHETAEAAINQNQTTRSEWRNVCEQRAVELGLEHALVGALDCVDRFFKTEVADWEFLSAEHPFSIEIDGFHVVGEIDCLARRPDGELVVLDYKATGSEKEESNRQLPLYILACKELFEESITTAGYVYVSKIGPDVDLRTYNDDRLADVTERIHQGLESAATSSYTEYTAGDHCKWCPHNDLPCSDFEAK
jgi:DNA helicase-2/ATP-dependent DNA helicase PcrA